MDRQPVLEGGGLLLRPLHADDRDALYTVASDPDLWALHPASDRWQEPVFDALFADALAQGGALAIVDLKSGAIIGSSQFRPSALAPGAMEIGWTFLARSHWGGATNRTLKRLMIGHALDDCERVVFRVGESNWRSRRALAKIGARLTDLRDAVTYTDGRVISHCVYAIDRTEFANGPLQD